jgi:hypothetical protein
MEGDVLPLAIGEWPIARSLKIGKLWPGTVEKLGAGSGDRDF